MPQSFLFVRSNDRTLGTSAAFKVALPQSFRNITSISLVSAELPYSCYNIDSPYCLGVSVAYNNVVHALALSPGFFQVDDVTAWLLGDLQSTYPAAGVSAVTYSKQTGRISIVYSGSATFAIQATSLGSLGRVLGADPLGLITYGSGGILALPSIATLAPINTILMRIAELPSLMCSTNGQSAFARLQMAAAPGSVVMQNVGSGVVNTCNFSTPIASLSTLTISLYSQDGVAVDLHGVEFSFTLLIVSA